MSSIPWFNETLQQHLQRAEQKRLHHALLLCGAKDIGKHWYAESLAKGLLCKALVNSESCNQCQSCQLFNAKSHPDYYWVATDKSQIGVDLIRSAIQSLSKTAQLSHNKVLIIADAHLMSESAANALLKTLEEPTQSTYLLLVTDQPHRLLPTIMSRCEKCVLPTPQLDVSIDWVRTQLKAETVHSITPELMQGYGNAPLAVLRSLEENDELAYDDFLHLAEALRAKQENILAAAEKWQQKSADVINWSQRWVHSLIKTEQYSMDQNNWDVVNKLQQLAETARHPGVNKVLLLVETFKLLEDF
ncbi:DNA polymerase III subunit delta' [Alteromonas flava]|uniref:DNA polymerase III subunit delta' n=1 Tax=Alteromonas flava TaxID=2048003 RepID=UPI000C28F4F2|nr:DNA polymerase III subunit delta' [Alteromonas flava]